MKPLRYLFTIVILCCGIDTGHAQILLLNACEGYDDGLLRFSPRMTRTSATTDRSILYYTLEEIIFLQSRKEIARTGIRNPETANKTAETVGNLMNGQGMRTVTPTNKALDVLKSCWEKDEGTLPKERFLELLGKNYGTDTLLLMTECEADFLLNVWKEPGKKQNARAGSATLLLKTAWAIYDCRAGKTVREFRAEGTGKENKTGITRKRFKTQQAAKYDINNMLDPEEREHMEKYRELFSLPSRLKVAPSERWNFDSDRPVHFGRPAIFPAIEQAAETIAREIVRQLNEGGEIGK